MRLFAIKLSLALILFLGVSAAIFFKDSLVFRSSPTWLTARESGTIFYDRLRAFEGYNVLNELFSYKTCSVFKMNGDPVFTFPGGHCLFLKSGALFTTDQEIMFFDADKKSSWTKKYFAHHDVFLTPQESAIYVIVDREEKQNGKKVLVEMIKGYDLDGQEIFSWEASSEINFFKSLVHSESTFLLPKPPVSAALEERWISTHFNSVQVLPPNIIEKTIPAFRAGNILINCYRFATMFIVDVATKKIVWHHRFDTPDWAGTHSVRLLENGRIFALLNKNIPDQPNDFSSLVEIDPLSGNKVWQYSSSPQRNFAMEKNGTAMQLPNGNSLVTHYTSGGSAFEVTHEGRVVWEWVYEDKDKNGKAYPIFSVQRVPKDRVDRVLKVWKPF